MLRYAVMYKKKRIRESTRNSLSKTYELFDKVAFIAISMQKKGTKLAITV